MDSNFEGTNMEQWQEIEGSPFEEMDELPFPAEDNLEMDDVSMPESEYVEEAIEENIEESMESETFEGTNLQECEEECSVVDPVAENATDISDEAEKAAKELEAEQEEERKRAEHEASEAKRKAEWEARQQEKKEAELRELHRLECMPDEEVMAASMQRISKDTERLTRRNMKDCVSEHVQTLCFEDAAFARLTMHPKKSMINCFHYINRKAREFVEQEMKDNDIKPDRGIYGSDVPDDLCYQWAENYFRDPDAPEDKDEKEEKFVPKPYTGKASSKSSKKKPVKKVSDKKATEKNTAAGKSSENITTDSKIVAEAEKNSLSGQMSFLDFLMPNTKAG